MDEKEILELLNQVQIGEITPSDAAVKLRITPFEELGYATLDSHRALRQGVQEVIYGMGKTKEQILDITEHMICNKCKNILITKMKAEAADYIKKNLSSGNELYYDNLSHIGVINWTRPQQPIGNIVIASGGTSDMPVCEEAALTAEVLGNKVTRIYDVGVAGIHRLLSKTEILMKARVIIVVAGMEGALASVIGGLTDVPIIAVPTSVGYGANFGGLAALLSMLNSCASGVSVVNIDNGFGAAFCASMINQIQRSDGR